MTSRVRRPRPPNSLELPQVTRVLARGGMLLDKHGAWSVFRCRDARRMRAGIVAHRLVMHLEAEGLACQLDGDAARLVAGPALNLQAFAATWASD